MASSKKINFNVDTKAVIKRKRRKSDLVIMWQSFCDVTSSVIFEFWSMILKIWQITRLWFDSSERLEIQTWLEKYLPWTPIDYDESWRDGCLLSILLNKLQPGCIPGAEKLDSEYSLRNVYHAFDVLEEYFNIRPDLSPEEIVTCANESEKKLYELLSQLKHATEIRTENEETIPKTELLEEAKTDENALNKHCIAKGTGLVVGFVERMTHFIVFFANLSDLDVVVDIKGPLDTGCSERITKRSPKKRCSSAGIADYNSSLILRSVSNIEDKINHEDENGFITKMIPLEYEILPNQINFAYKPLYKGQHKISVLWHGFHVSDSPYTVAVEDACQIPNSNNSAYIKPALKSSNIEDKSDIKKPSVRFQDSKEMREKFGKTLKKRVLRYIVKIDGKDVAVDTKNTDSLATELLKMDYDYDNNFSLCRRNSWGFTGDAERKVSVIRQFCVDVDVMEAQSKHKRSKSLVVGKESKNAMSRSDSLDDLRLNSIAESAIKNGQDYYSSDDTFAHMDFDSSENLLEEDVEIEVENPDSPPVDSSSFDERQMNSEEVKETPIIKSCYIPRESKLERTDLISSLSAGALLCKAENLNDDLKKSSDILCENINEKLPEPNKRDNIEAKSDELKQISFQMRNDSGTRKTNKRSTKVPVFVKKKSIASKEIANKKLSNPRKGIKLKNTRENRLDQTFKKANRVIKKDFTGKLPVSSHGDTQVNEELRNLTTEGNFIHSENIPKDSETDEVTNFNYNIQPLQMNFPESTDVISQNGDDANKYDIRNPSSSSSECMNNTKSMSNESIASPAVSRKGTQYRTSNEIRVTSLPYGNKFENKLNKSYKEISYDSATCSAHQSNNIVDHQKSHPIKTHSLLSIGHYNFKQFNPPSGNEASFRVKNRILEWEATISGENKNLKNSKNIALTETLDTVDVKAKLCFWENAYKKEETTPIDDIETDRFPLKGSMNSDGARNISDGMPFDNTGRRQKKMDEKILTTAETSSFLNTVSKKELENKSPDVIRGPSSKQIRSFSDSIIDTSKRSEEANFDTPFEMFGDIFSSNDVDLAVYSSDDESSEPDHLKVSTEDEYIDDEISESTPMFWGELSLLTKQKHSNTSSDAEFNEFLDPDYFRQRYLSSNFYPSECKIFGIANYYGYVAVKNRFQVLTKDAGIGNLSVSVQGFGQHDVSLVSVTYRIKDIYDVMYQVMSAGYYIISVRWMDSHIPGSPFVCKVTF